jgi:hypothetical protein
MRLILCLPFCTRQPRDGSKSSERFLLIADPEVGSAEFSSFFVSFHIFQRRKDEAPHIRTIIRLKMPIMAG